jgi:hypothetical protein
MKGIEGLPLKYILIVVVAGLIIAAIIAFTTSMTQTLEQRGAQVTGVLNETSKSSARSICEDAGCLWTANATPGHECNCTK